MQLNQLNLADIRAFVLIAKLGNFTKAAEELEVSRSHVSRQLSQLENSMGVTLVIRTTRSLSLTDAGELFYRQCEQALSSIEQAVLAAVDDVQEARGELRINSVGGHIGEELIADICSAFMQENPDVRIHLDFSSHRVDLIEEGFDVAFRMGKLEDASFVARKLTEIRMSTLASPTYFTLCGQPQHPKQLTDHRCLTGSVKRWSYQHKETKQTLDVPVDGDLQCKNGRVLVRAALAHNGIIRVPTFYCHQEIARGELVEVFQDWHIPSVDFSLIYHKDKYQPVRLKRFIEFSKRYFEQGVIE
ncbi:TPA: LysR family transcriptional regulator [Vibrio cholerae]|uniref:LysR family transcriptional regulator n=1 Tax=Vibrio cholerae TaxID=666 RepID=UPI001184E995|nr:LysR family transcriptional regulator [Vibrio cholerae]MVB89366.1 LysR family transcriptional regulator [Vibrio cholerae]MVC75151.1 LysR family transcriptional regulator [Vibrio cholerae]MVC78433.1 LysR family transcriptional regulator [Vibrio cholerae]TVN34899.1 LysR family transcriptional regulator [Vibrio cholerae]HDV5285629.1 LysR family transcriptional regulator [Vibrio cholerae]